MVETSLQFTHWMQNRTCCFQQAVAVFFCWCQVLWEAAAPKSLVQQQESL